jgi:hypothetical protein
MTRSLALFALFTLGPAFAAAAEPTWATTSKAASPSRSGAPAGKQSSKEKLGQELLTILSETTSEDTFLVTLEVLSAADIDPAVAIPAIIRNAERLGMLDGFSKGDRQDKAQEAIGEVLKHFCDKCEGGRRGTSCYSASRVDPLVAPPMTPSFPVVPSALPVPTESYKIPSPR